MKLLLLFIFEFVINKKIKYHETKHEKGKSRIIKIAKFS